MMITRRKAVPQVIGFLALENGLFFAATSTTYGMPLAVELGIALVAVRQGWLREKLRGWAWLAGHAAWLRDRRRVVQQHRSVRDRELARFLTPVLDPRMLELPAGVSVVNGAVSAWWRGARVFL
jgi:hypothetical protein